jgi:hypothetical protein
MRMRCSRCHRWLLHPVAAFHGQVYGRVCAAAEGLITVKTRPSAKHPKPVNPDQLEIFYAEAAPAPALQPEGPA